MGIRDLSTFRDAVRTKLSRPEAAEILVRVLGAVEAWNGEQLRIAAAILLAQADFETATFGSIWNHNWGNVRTTTASPFTLLPGAVDEYIAGKHVVASDPDDPLRVFRAYDTAESGCRAWAELIQRAYPWAWSVLLAASDGAESAVAFARALGDPGQKRRYYTANRERYAAGVGARWPACRKAVWGE